MARSCLLRMVLCYWKPFVRSFPQVLSFHVTTVACCRKSRWSGLERWCENSKPHACQTRLRIEKTQALSKKVCPSVIKVLFLRSCRVCGSEIFATFGKEWVWAWRPRPVDLRCTFLAWAAVTYRDAQARRGLTWPRLLGRVWVSPIKRVVGQVHWRPSLTVVGTFNFWSALISVESLISLRSWSAFALCIAAAWPAARILCLHVTLLVLPACACTLACLVPRMWAACMGRTRC